MAAVIFPTFFPILSCQIGTDVLSSESHVVVVLAARNSALQGSSIGPDSRPAARMASCSHHEVLMAVSSNGHLPRKMSKSSSWIHLNVGGKIFMTTRQTLLREPQSFFSRLCLDDEALPSDQDETGAYLIDRDPKYFGPVLNWLRHGKLVLDHGVSEEGVLEEAEFYNLPNLVTIVQERIADRNERRRKQVDESANKKETCRLRSVYRVMGCDGHDELTATVSQLTDGWKLVQVMVNANYTVDQSHEFLVIVTRECPDNDIPMDIQDRAGHIQQRARNN